MVIGARIASQTKPLALAALNLLYPPLCFSCRIPVSETGTICAACWNRISFLDGPCCEVCGLPFELDPGGAALCAACYAKAPPFDRARAVMRYDEHSKGPILSLKHADRLDLVPGFGRWLERAGRDLIDDADVITSVPLHRFRLWRRRYNQASELAHVLAVRNAKSHDPLLLRRIRATKSQGAAASAKARARNVRGAFAVERGRDIRGRTILLVDDVYTTGATVSACARVLKRAGAAKILVLSLARVVRA